MRIGRSLEKNVRKEKENLSCGIKFWSTGKELYHHAVKTLNMHMKLNESRNSGFALAEPLSIARQSSASLDFEELIPPRSIKFSKS